MHTRLTYSASLLTVAFAWTGGLGGFEAAAFAQTPETPPEAPRPRSFLRSQEQRMLSLAKLFAKRCQETMEGWIDGEEVTQEQLFSFLYYPVQDTDPPKFSTDWDELADRDIRYISDNILSKSSAIAFAVLVDRNGYLPAHNRKYSLPLTGNPAVDLIGNRTKRIFADKTGLAAARNNEAYLLQRYSRDTGELMRDLSVPVVIKGEKWGSVRIGYRVVDE